MSTIDDAKAGKPGSVRSITTKVPEITVYFWVVKILTTGMGEATSDYFSHTLGRVLAGVIGGLALLAALVLQFSVRRYVTWAYWLAVVMVSVFGTMAADDVHFILHLPFWASTVLYAVVLTAIFVAWYAVERTLSIHSIDTRRREGFYWATVLATFALGTAVGDWTASSLQMGYLASGLMFGVLILIPAVAHRGFGLNPIAAFWFAYVLTRPLGASFADWLDASHKRHGLAFGAGPVSLVSSVVILALVGYVAVSGKDRTATADA
jgi:uncharacterized membrane-anchored protein